MGLGLGLLADRTWNYVRVMKRSIVRQAERQTHALVWEEDPTNRMEMKSEDTGRSFRPADSLCQQSNNPLHPLKNLLFLFPLSIHPLPNVLATSDRIGSASSSDRRAQDQHVRTVPTPKSLCSGTSCKPTCKPAALVRSVGSLVPDDTASGKAEPCTATR